MLHQHQRPRRTLAYAGRQVPYIEVTPADIALANTLAHEVFGRSLDELAPQTRRLLDLLDALVTRTATAEQMVRGDVRFTRRQVRAATGWSDFQTRTHLGRLVDLEYVLAHRGSRGASYVYELLHDGGGQPGTPHLPGLTDPATLTGCDYDPDYEPPEGEFEGTSSPGRAPVREGCHPAAHGGRRPLMPAPRYRPPADQVDPASLLAAVGQFCEWLAIRNYSPRTITGYESNLLAFVAWAGERSVHRPTEVTLPMLERYQRALFYRRKPDGSPLTVRAQVGHLVALRALFRWLARQRRILYDPASALELPRTRRLLPRGVLTVAEVEAVLAVPDLASIDGLRDRAILETFYSTAIRAQEAAGLGLFDLDVARSTVHRAIQRADRTHTTKGTGAGT